MGGPQILGLLLSLSELLLLSPWKACFSWSNYKQIRAKAARPRHVHNRGNYLLSANTLQDLQQYARLVLVELFCSHATACFSTSERKATCCSNDLCSQKRTPQDFPHTDIRVGTRPARVDVLIRLATVNA